MEQKELEKEIKQIWSALSSMGSQMTYIKNLIERRLENGNRDIKLA